MTPQPSARAQVIARRTYARPLDEAGTIFETWAQTVDRVISHQRWLYERARNEQPLTAEQHLELAELRQLLYERKSLVSGRTLWLGGTEISKKRESSQFNPLPRSTRFITAAGVKSFEDFEDGDTTSVITHTGDIRNAVVNAAGTRKMLRLSLRRGRSLTTQDTCVDHTWILLDGSRVAAKDLAVGDRLHKAPAETFYAWDFDAAEVDEQFWWCYGFVFGDGAIAKSGNSVTSRVRLCGEKAKHLPRFTACGFDHSLPPSCLGDPFVYTGAYLKTLPDDGTDIRLIRAFLCGYLDADSKKAYRNGKTVSISMAVKCKDAADFLARWLPVFGVYITHHEHVDRPTNYGTFSGYEFRFTTHGSVGGLLWTVESVDEIKPQDCWCLTVDGDHSFVLPNGVVTGNCSFLRVVTIHDVVDTLWLLLQGCGVGFEPVVGNLNGFTKPAEIEVIRSQRHLLVEQRGRETNSESLIAGVYTVQIGDSAEAWAKAVGKILAQKAPFSKIVLDFSQIRPAGYRLRGYGWISSGDETLHRALVAICEIMNRKAGQLLDRIDILDVINWLGTTLSSRRSAEIALVPYGDPQWRQFATAKKDYFDTNPQRGQSNNSLLLSSRPSKHDLRDLLEMMVASGGSEPGFINAEQALARAPWFKGVNPCLAGETLVSVVGRGLVPIRDLAGTVAIIRDARGDPVAATFKMTSADAEVWSMHMDDGTVYRATPNHEFVRANGRKSTLQEIGVLVAAGHSIALKPAAGASPTSAVAVTATPTREPVYCCGVTTTGSFDLQTIHSGNCAEILLGDRSFCNLVESVLPKFNGDWDGLLRAHYLIARANYRQTCVNLQDGILQSTWHELNQYLRLCGVGVTGVAAWEHRGDAGRWKALRAAAVSGCNSMADELGLPRAKAVTTVKPSGTLSKIADSPEGLHTPLGEYIINNVRFSTHDPVLEPLRAAGYRVWQDPTSPDAMLVSFPVHWKGVDFERDAVTGKAVNRESALTQLERYKLLMGSYVDYNASATISYSVDEIGDITNWIHKNFDNFVGVSFLFRNDATKTAADLGYKYLPQQVVTEAEYQEYASQIRPFDLDATPKFTKAKGGGVDQTQMSVDAGDECAGGVCPVR